LTYNIVLLYYFNKTKFIKGEIMEEKKDMDIIRNMRAIEWLKSELLSNVAYLYEVLAKGEEDTKDNLKDIVSNVVLTALLLSRRLGLSYEDVFSSLEDNIRANVLQQHKIEKWYGDLSELLELIRTK
jgi:NTP pyrophosphatase (non-canonical NTP hydrolase)